jgi:hypothetical protein
VNANRRYVTSNTVRNRSGYARSLPRAKKSRPRAHRRGIGPHRSRLRQATPPVRLLGAVGYIRLARTYGDVFGDVFPELPLELCGSGYLARQVEAERLETDDEIGPDEEAWFQRIGSNGGLPDASHWNESMFTVPKEGLEPSHPYE